MFYVHYSKLEAHNPVLVPRNKFRASLLRRDSNIHYINPLSEVSTGAKSNGSYILDVFLCIDRFLGFG